MTFRGVMIHGALALASCLVAYLAWQRAQDGDEPVDQDSEAQVVAFSLARSDLKRVEYLSPERTVALEVPLSGQPHWITVTSKTRVLPSKAPAPPRAEPDGGAVASSDEESSAPAASSGDAGPGDGGSSSPAAPPEVEYREKTVRFVGNEEADELLDGLAPFKVIRRLGTLNDEQKGEFGLDEPDATLRLTLSEGTKEFAVGMRTYGGGGHYYILDENGEGYLFHSSVIRQLSMADPRLKQLSLVPSEMDDVASVKLVAAAGEQFLELRDRPEEGSWAVKGSPPESASKAYTNWMGRLKLLRALEYPPVDGGAAFQPEGTPALRVTYFGKAGASLGTTEIGSLAPSKEGQFVARTDETHVWVRISRSVAEQLLEDLDDILGSSPPES